MFTLQSGKPYSLCDGMSRRRFLQAGMLGGLGLADLLRLQAQPNGSSTVFKTPEEAWQGFLDALASGDRAAMTRVVGPNAYQIISPMCKQQLKPEGLKLATQGLRKEPFKIQPIGTATDRVYLCLKKIGEKTVFSDTFTGLPGESGTLPGHTPDLGTGWVLNEDSSRGTTVLWQVYSTCHKAAPTSARSMDFHNPRPGGEKWKDPYSVRVSYYATPNPALSSADYHVQFLLREAAKGSSNLFTWAMLRRTAADTYYGAGWYSVTKAKDADDSYIFKVIGGKYMQLASGKGKFDDGSIVKFGVVGDTLTLYKDGAKILSAEGGNAISAIGAGGFGAGNIRVATDAYSAGQSIDNFDIVEKVPVDKDGTWENASPLTFIKVANGWKIETKLQGFCRFIISCLPGFLANAHSPG